jgi:hypothetical protein
LPIDFGTGAFAESVPEVEGVSGGIGIGAVVVEQADILGSQSVPQGLQQGEHTLAAAGIAVPPRLSALHGERLTERGGPGKPLSPVLPRD